MIDKIKDLFSDKKIVSKIQKRLPELFQIAVGKLSSW